MRSSSAAPTWTPPGILPTRAEVDAVPRGSRRRTSARGWSMPCSSGRSIVDYWAYKWSDLLLVSSRSLGRSNVRSFYDWIRASVAANVPWDRFVRELTTASGRTDQVGAANYFLIHRNPIDIAENYTQAFLGPHADVRAVPQPPAGEVDAARLLPVREPVRARHGEGRRPGICDQERHRAGVHRRHRGDPAPAPRRRASAASARRRGDEGRCARGSPRLRGGLADLAGQHAVRADDRQPRVGQPARPRARASDRRPARHQPGLERGAVRRAHGRLRRARVRREAPDPHDHDVRDVPAVGRHRRDEREGRPLLLAPPDAPPAGGGDPRRVLAGDGRADAVRGLSARAPVRCSCPTRRSTRTS